MQLETIIGLEIHTQLKTKTKMFCRCANNNNAEINTNICPICLAHPGTLPVLNKKAVRLGIKLALALNADLNYISEFARKNYFYPDLPKSYQISQDDKPLAWNGHVNIFFNNKWKKCNLERLHLEEDSAKNLHSSDAKYSWINFNRAGIPLIEIVTKPEFHYPEEARLFLEELKLTLKELGISDANMEKGELRCDANISLRPLGDEKYYAKTEIKNLNSFKAVEKALKYEISRQKALWENNEIPNKSETRAWDEKNNKTIIQRSKETLNDYRYFPEPDLNILKLNNDLIKEISKEIKLLPWQKRKLLLEEYHFDNETITYLLENKFLLKYLENTISELEEWLNSENINYELTEIAKLTSNYLINKVSALLNKTEQNWENIQLSAENMAELLKMLIKKEINKNIAVQFLEKMISAKKDTDPSHLLDEMNLNTDLNLEDIIKNILNNNPDAVEKYKNGKTELMKFFIGQVMRETKGQADAKETENILKNLLK